MPKANWRKRIAIPENPYLSSLVVDADTSNAEARGVGRGRMASEWGGARGDSRS